MVKSQAALWRAPSRRDGVSSSIAVESDLTEGAVVDMKLARGKVVMMPVRSHKPTLEELLEAKTEENLHGEIDFGPPAGKEVW